MAACGPSCEAMSSGSGHRAAMSGGGGHRAAMSSGGGHRAVVSCWRPQAGILNTAVVNAALSGSNGHRRSAASASRSTRPIRFGRHHTAVGLLPRVGISGHQATKNYRTSGFARWSGSANNGLRTLSQSATEQQRVLPVMSKFTTYRQSHDDDVDDGDDEDDNNDNEEEEEEEEAGGDLNDCTRGGDKINTTTVTFEDDNRPLSPWGDKCRAKQKIISDLKNDASDIHLFVPDPPTDFKTVNFDTIHKKYASRYKKSNFKNNFKRILTNFANMTGPFKADNETVPWKSRERRSPGWHLLYGLRMDPSSNARVNSMPVEELWNSNMHFKRYPLKDFKTYNREMITLTNKVRGERAGEEKVFQAYIKKFPHKQQTDRGEPFWYNHPANDLLAADVKCGVACKLKPKQLYATRPEYRQFKLETFRKHIYQEQARQRAAPYWRLKRNIAAQKNL